MSFQALKDESKVFHIIMTTSDQAKAYIKKLMQGICSTEPGQTGYAKSREQLKTMIQEYMVPPFLTEEWLGVIDYSSSLNSMLRESKQKLQTGYGRYIIFCRTYKDFKEVKSVFAPELVNTLYLSRLTFGDITWIMGKRSVKLSEKMMKDICAGYSRNIEAIFNLCDYLDQGGELETRKDLELICGMPDADLNRLVLNLVKQIVEWQEKYDGKTYREWNTSIRKSIPSRLKPLLKTAEGYSPQYVRVSLENIIYTILRIKELYLDTEIYRAEDLKDQGEDLQRMARYFDQIIETPVNALLYLYNTLSKKDYWQTQLDIVEFVYDLYGQSAE